jgi:hypothetical protein
MTCGWFAHTAVCIDVSLLPQHIPNLEYMSAQLKDFL